MVRHTHNKLVRDKIPSRIESSGGRAYWKTIEGTDFRHALLMKVIEEAKEYEKDTSPKEECDLQEIFLKARQIYGYTKEDVSLSHKIGTTSGVDFGNKGILYHASDYIKDPSAATEAEVQEALAKARAIAGYTPEQVEEARIQKAHSNGAFELGIYLFYTESVPQQGR